MEDGPRIIILLHGRMMILQVRPAMIRMLSIESTNPLAVLAVRGHTMSAFLVSDKERSFYTQNQEGAYHV
jgi:hypothetical protein